MTRDLRSYMVGARRLKPLERHRAAVVWWLPCEQAGPASGTPTGLYAECGFDR